MAGILTRLRRNLRTIILASLVSLTSFLVVYSVKTHYFEVGAAKSEKQYKDAYADCVQYLETRFKVKSIRDAARIVVEASRGQFQGKEVDYVPYCDL